MNIINKFKIDCHKATVLVSESLDKRKLDIGISDRIKLYIHLAICKSCNNYNIQITKLHNAFIINKDKQLLPNLKLSLDSENKIQQEINNKLNKQKEG